MEQQTYGVAEFTRASSHVLAQAARTGGPIAVERSRAPYVAIVSAHRLRQLTVAEDIMQGLITLASRGADCAEYQAYAEAIAQLVARGHLDVREDSPSQEPEKAA